MTTSLGSGDVNNLLYFNGREWHSRSWVVRALGSDTYSHSAAHSSDEHAHQRSR
jgi:hypothetical protein